MKQKTKTLGVASILVVILFLFCVFALLPQSVQAATLTTTVTVGNGAGGVAVTPNGAYVYVTNNNDNTVSVISTTNNTVTATVAVGNGPEGVAVTPNGEYVYVTNNYHGTVSVISTTNNTVTATITVGNGPGGIAITPNGAYAYITNNNDNTVSVISTTNNTVTATITVGNGPGGIAITPNGAYAYITNHYSGNSVSVINTATNTVTETVLLGGYSYYMDGGSGGVAITPNGAYVYVTNSSYYGSNSVSVINTATNTVTATVDLGGESDPYGGGSGGVAITPNGAYAYATNSDWMSGNSVSIINTTTNTMTETVLLGGSSYYMESGSGGVTITPNGAYAYVTSGGYGSNTVSVINTSEIDTFEITVSQGANGVIAPGTTTVDYGEDQEFTFTPATGYHIVAIIVNGSSVGTTSPYTVSDVTEATSLTAEFAIDTFTVTVGDHTHGSISSTNGTTVNYGNDLSFSITPDTGYHLVSVLIDGETASAPYNFVNVTATHTISATFAIDTYAITVSQGANGVIAPGTTTVDYGADQEFTFTPATGYHIVEVKMNGTTVTTTSQHTVSNVTGATSLTAEFAINTYAITITHSANGFISGPRYANYGTDASYTIVPVTGYHIVNVIVDGVSKGATASYTINNIQATHTVTAIFAVNIDAITATVTTTGDTYGVGISGNVTAQQMSNVTITPHQLTTTTIVSFTITGPSGTVGFGNMTLPKTAIPYGTNPVVYIDGNQALNQGYTQDTNNFYVWYTTHFSTHEITILFRSTPSLTPTATPNPPASMSLSVPVIGAIVLICLVLIGLLVKRKKNQNPQVLS
jgi:YVTN family beta-propeller protein